MHMKVIYAPILPDITTMIVGVLPAKNFLYRQCQSELGSLILGLNLAIYGCNTEIMLGLLINDLGANQKQYVLNN